MTVYRIVRSEDLLQEVPYSELVGREPISEEKIDAYKHEQVERHPASKLWEASEKLGGPRRLEMLVLGLLCLAFFTLVMSLCLLATYPDSGYLTNLSGLMVIISGTVMVALIALAGGRWTLRGPSHWEEVPVPYWELPTFAKQIVDDIWRIYPKAWFSVDLLKQNESVLDPILYLYAKGKGSEEKVALCVWDEDGKEVIL